MTRPTYLLVLAFIVLGTAWLPWASGARVLGKVRRLGLALLPGMVLFTAWDVYAVRRGHWWFDPAQVMSLRVFGVLPLEELLFFAVIPTAAVLTLEAVRALRGWRVGDEP